jgi:two-component system, OmpR family, KDP operon response regulator KdpE
MPSQRILICSPDERLRVSIAAALRSLDAVIHTAPSGAEALITLYRHSVAVVLLDLDPAPAAGWVLLDQIRTRFTGTALIVCSHAAQHQQELIAGLERGADLYLPKPIDLAVLRAQMRALLRHPHAIASGGNASADHAIRLEQLTIDPERRSVVVGVPPDERYVRLNRSEFDTLLMLARNAGRVVAYDEVITAVWGQRYASDASAVHTQISRIRKKLATYSGSPQILNIPRSGYRLIVTSDSASTLNDDIHHTQSRPQGSFSTPSSPST